MGLRAKWMGLALAGICLCTLCCRREAPAPPASGPAPAPRPALVSGFSLVYKCASDGDGPADLSARMIEVLRQRVDPCNIHRLEWTPCGSDRFEVRMPAPSPEAAQARAAWLAALEALAARGVDRAQVERAMANLPTPRERADLNQTDAGKAQAVRRREAFTAAVKGLQDSHKALAGEIARGAVLFEAWQACRQDMDDPSDLKRRILKMGLLEFRIAPFGPNSTFGMDNPRHELVVPQKDLDALLKQLEAETPGQLAAHKDKPYAWFPMRRTGEPSGQTVRASGPGGGWYILLCTAADKTLLRDAASPEPWQLLRARRDTDTYLQPCVDFTLDAQGARRMRELTGQYNRDKVPPCGAHLAILLDNEVYSTPTIQSTIGADGQITGRFTEKEVADLVGLLTAGSLPGRLVPDPVAESSFGPTPATGPAGK